ncbi:hypothetical protein [Yoonia sp. 2307UL14-13]|uniref:hypothetical protein n=1 Tax=Yoonia sp. 2307UL14-13 TaxID=3126506 RepID=UPI0030AFD753
MNDTDLFLVPVQDTANLAVRIAAEAQDGELGETAEKAYQAEFDRLQQATGLTVAELDDLGAPKTAIGRLFERVQDWWWDKTSGFRDDAQAALEAAFSFPVPLLRTYPLQDTPFEYDEVDRQMAEATAQITAAISQRTAWEPMSFTAPEPDDDVFDPVTQILTVWKMPNTTSILVLIDQFEEDPKLMGHTLGIVHLVGTPAQSLAALLR